jgi:uncharacterized membrane protein YuzA (DUF378 family)
VNLFISLLLVIATLYFGTVGAFGVLGVTGVTGLTPNPSPAWTNQVYIAIAISALITVIVLVRNGNNGHGGAARM